ncbi:MAG: insulinase family protein [Kiritimatiellae bacterium]|nr:insulinase family protein [Kiritimatiellia bacterium]
MPLPSVAFKSGQEIGGFRVVAVTPVASLRAQACQFEHLASGARVLHVFCDDAENAFSINFATPPPDDTGMPHILEHMVLAGSRKFPVKEPFFEMVKMSMATFINAMTGHDCTYYPVCSNVRQDLFNLADVYFDAVFHPLLTEQTFQREAHHLGPADPAQPAGALRLDGVVYSEMKGVFSDPEAILSHHAIRALLPDTCYGRESGGTPEAIPNLTYAQLRAFHADHYHPGNACICLYGDIPPADYLSFLTPRLAPFRRAAAAPRPARQTRWSRPRLLRDGYPIGAHEPRDAKTYLLMNWLAGDAHDPVDAARVRVLSLLLLWHEAAPLHRALIDSRLGADLVMSGASEAGPEATFHVGLEGSEPDRLDTFRNLVLDTLRHVADTPFTSEQVQTAFQQAAYECLEIQPLFPLHNVFRVVEAWMAGLDPLTFLEMDQHYATVRAAYAADPRLFNRLIAERLLDNPHRLDVLLEPGGAGAEQREAAAAERLARQRASLSDAEAQAIAAAAVELDRANAEPNPPEAVALLPQLKATDLPAEPQSLPTTTESLPGGAVLLANDMLTNGIVYLCLQFDLTGLPQPLWALLPRYTEALNKFGAAGQDYAAIARRLGASTGGIAAAVSFDTRVDDPGRLLPALRISLKTVAEQVPSALDLLGDLLFALDPRDGERMRDVLVQARAENRNAMVQDGSGTVRLHAARGASVVHHLGHTVSGLPQLALTERWVEDFERGRVEVAAGIEAIRDFILNRRRVTASLTAPPAARDAVRQRLAQWLERMRAEPVVPGDTQFTPWESPRLEGLAAHLQIAHCAMVLRAPHRSSPDEPLLSVGAHLVTMDYMLPEIRFRGNAYGASFSHQPLAGTFTLSSFRDPHIAETIAVFRGVADYIHRVAWTQTDIDRGIIGVAKRDEKPLRPGEATGVALMRHTLGETWKRRLERRRQLLRATPETVRQALLRALEAELPRAAICVMSGREQLERAKSALGAGTMTIEDVLPAGQCLAAR